MKTEYEVLVAGLGAFGSAALDALASRGVRVLGLDRFHPPHAMGSSHGRTRIIREAYFEDPFYVPLARRAYDDWQELEGASGEQLLRPCGGLMVGPPEGDLVAGTLASVREHDIPHQLLDAGELTERFPDLRVQDSHVGVLEERAGVLMVDGCIRTLQARAQESGAQIRTGEAVRSWQSVGDEVEVTTDGGIYRTGTLVLTVGPWLGALAGPSMAHRIRVERQVCVWVEAELPGDWPVVVWQPDEGRILYTIPDLGHGFKAGLHHGGPATDPDEVDRAVTAGDEGEILSILRRLAPRATGSVLDSSVCLYTNTPDHQFVLGPHPEDDRVIVAGGGSGHGFKFAPVMGRMAASLVLAASSGTGPPEDGLPIPSQFAPHRLLDPPTHSAP